MVRVGGGWVALDEFLVKNDPCRGKFPSTTILLILLLYEWIIIQRFLDMQIPKLNNYWFSQYYRKMSTQMII